MDQYTKPEKYTPRICSACGIGHLEEKPVVYAHIVDGMLLAIPDVTAFACDVCGYREFDLGSYQWVEDWDDESLAEIPPAMYALTSSRRQQS